MSQQRRSFSALELQLKKSGCHRSTRRSKTLIGKLKSSKPTIKWLGTVGLKVVVYDFSGRNPDLLRLG
jgi:hypothetical protein